MAASPGWWRTVPGAAPRAVATTTPRPVPLLMRLLMPLTGDAVWAGLIVANGALLLASLGSFEQNALARDARRFYAWSRASQGWRYRQSAGVLS